MFLRSVWLGNFLYDSLGALKQWRQKTFLSIGESSILENLNDFNPPLGDVPQVGSAWQFFLSFPGCIQAIVPKKFFGNQRTLNFGEIKQFHPLFRGCSSGRISFAIFYIIPWVHSSNCAEKLFWESTNLEFCKKLNDFIPSLGDVPQVGAAWKFFISLYQHLARASVQEWRGKEMRAMLSLVLVSRRDTQPQSVFF